MSIKTYDRYKESGITWLGKVPATWKVAAIKHGFDIKLGKMLQPDSKGEGDTLAPYVRAANIQWKGVDASDIRLMWFSPQERAELALQENDLLVSEGGDVGRACLWRNELEECYFQNSVNRARSKPGNSTGFGRYWLSTLKNKGFIDVLCNKSTIAHYTAEKLAATPALLPPHSEQVAIAAFLDRETAKIDALVAEQQHLIELLQEKKQAVISHAVTKGLNPNAAMKDSGVEWLGEVPEHWEVKKIKHLGTIRYGIGEPPEYKEEGVPLIRATNVCSGEITKENMAYVDPADIPVKRIIWLKEGDIIVVRSGALTGDSAIIKSEYVDSIAGFDMVLSCTEAVPTFVQYCLLSPGLKAAQIDISKQRAAQPHLNSEELGQCLIAEPPATEQREICDYLDRELCDCKSLIDKSLSMTELLRERRSALISAAVTGQIDVRGLVTEEQP